jgi:hypothetical protein
MDFPQPIIDSVYRKSCDGDSRPYGKLAANRGWWEPGTSKYGGISLLSFSSEVVRQ